MTRTPKRTLRGRFAVASGRMAGVASRMLGRGSGGMIGGRVALGAHPGVLRELCRDRQVVLVTGTNGKSTTTKMIRAALGGADVASNVRGDNMPAGIVTALMNFPRAKWAAIEVDEMHLPSVAAEVKPAAIVLLNLSRDQLDRVGEIGTVERRLRRAVDENPQALIVANCDDPLVASAAWDAPNVLWVAAGSGWGADSASFPRGGRRVLRSGDDWSIEGNPDLKRPDPAWWIEGRELVTGEERYRLNLSLPGEVNLKNAAQAVACAVGLGVSGAKAVRAVESVDEVAGRYQRFDVEGRQIRLLLAKNPAGWQESLSMAHTDAGQVIIGVNGQKADGQDLSWLWDIDFENWDQSVAIASGERSADLAARLVYAGIEATLIADPLEAILSCKPGAIDVLVNYTCFRDLLSTLRARGFKEIPSDEGTRGRTNNE